MKKWKKLVETADRVVEQTVHKLPDEIRAIAGRVPVSFEEVPSPEMEEEGIAGDTLGLFVGESYEDSGTSMDPLPGQILLFLGNIWAFADEAPEEYREEVRITYLHELGHYLGWDEEDLLERNLD